MKLREYLNKNQITQQEFANSVGVARPFITLILSGKKNPSPHLMKIIEDVTNGEVTMQDLFNPNVPSRLKKRKKTENT